MALKRQIEIDVNVQEAIKNMNDLGSSFEDVFGEVKPLNTQIGEMEDALYEMSAAGLQNTKEFRDLATQIGAMKKVVIDTDLAVDGMAQSMAQKLGGSLGGVTAGFELGTGAMGAFGVESEAVEGALLRVQSAMAISQGIQGIKEAIPSFVALRSTILTNVAALNLGTVASKAMSMAMKAIPIVALAAAALAISKMLGDWATESIKASKGIKTLADQHEELNSILERQRKLIDQIMASNTNRWNHELAMLEATGASEDEIHKMKMRQLDLERKQVGVARQLELDAIEAQRLALSQARKDGNTELATSIEEELEASKERYRQLDEQHKGYVDAKELEDANYQRHLDEEAEKEKERNRQKYQDFLAQQQQYNSNRLAAERLIQDEILGLMTEGQFKEEEANRIKFERLIEDTKTNETLLQTEKDRIISIFNEQRKIKEQEIRDKYVADWVITETQKQEAINNLPPLPDVELPPYDPEADPALKEEKMRGSFWLGIREEFRKKDDESFGEYVSRLNDKAQEHTGNMMQGLQSLSDLNDALTDAAVAKAGSNEKAAEAARKKGFERSKKLQLTMAIIQGVQGVMAAFTAGSSMGPAGVVMGPLMAALAAVTAGINVAKISKMKYESGGTGGGGGAVPRAPSVPSPASFNVVGNDGTNQLADTLGEQPPIKAQVVSEEVTTQQSLDRNRMDNASFG